MAGETQAPERLGPYRLLRKIGEGGMGVVHLGLDEEGREVAVKVLHPHVAADLKARDRLTREVETMRRVRSPHVAEVLDAELTAAQPYIVTRYAPGTTLEEKVLADGPLSPAELVRLARGLTSALVAIHAADVIHRDFKPSNVMLVGGEPLVIDFGIAHLVNATRLTQTGMFVGTPGYLAPEIIRDAEITQAADVHALASTIFFGATGKPPFGSGTFEVVCFNIMEGRAQIDLAPQWLQGWLKLALAVDASTRPTAAALHRLARSLDPRATSFHETARSTVPNGMQTFGSVQGAVPGANDGTQVLSDGTKILADGTRVLGDGTQVLKDGTRVLADGTRILGAQDGTTTPTRPGPPRGQAPPPPAGTRVLPSDGGFADILPPVEYGKPERRPRPEKKPKSSQVKPPPYVPAPPSAQGQPPRTAPPPPYVDQRVAGYPPPQQPPPYQPPAQVRPYVPPPPPATARPPYQPLAADQPRYRAGHPVAGALLLAVLVAMTCVYPVVGGLVALVAALCLRVGEYLFGSIAQRRKVRGSSASDPVVAVLGTPWALIKAAFVTVVSAPLAAMFGMCVWGVLNYAVGIDSDLAAAYAAGGFAAGLFVLPGGGAPRKAVARTLTGAIRSPGAGMIATLVLGTLAFFAVLAVFRMDPSFQPWRPPSQVTKELVQQGKDSVMGLITGLIDDLMTGLGLGFLTRWL